MRRQRDWLQTPAADEPPLRVAYQGTEGAYGHEAARAALRRRTPAGHVQGVPVVPRDARSGAAGRRASAASCRSRTAPPGSVHEVYDLLFRLNLARRRRGDPRSPALPARRARAPPLEGADRASTPIRRRWRSAASSWPSAAACETEPAANTALAAERVARARRPAQAAIASAEAGDRHGLLVLARDIANQAVNFTRFVVVAAAPRRLRSAASPPRCRWSSATRHERGALVRCLNVLADEGVSLTKLESRPQAGHGLGVRVLRRRRGASDRAADAVGAGRAGRGAPCSSGAGLLSARRRLPTGRPPSAQV